MMNPKTVYSDDSLGIPKQNEKEHISCCSGKEYSRIDKIVAEGFGFLRCKELIDFDTRNKYFSGTIQTLRL